MKKTDLLKTLFQQTDYHALMPLLDMISSKTKDGNIFPPYIPLVGEQYNEYRILAYATAQNMAFDSTLQKIYACNFNKLVERLYYFNKPGENCPGYQKKYPDDEIHFHNVDIYPYQTGIMPALLGVFLYARYRKIVKNLNQIVQYTAVNNYYKFSLHNGRHDIHPEPNGKNPITQNFSDMEAIRKYWAFNDRLACLETEILKPRAILVFKGRKAQVLQSQCINRCEILPVNDPSWILNGHGGHLSPGGSWHRKVEECAGDEVKDLINWYLLSLTGKYYAKREAVRVYLTYYYCRWKISSKIIRMFWP